MTNGLRDAILYIYDVITFFQEIETACRREKKIFLSSERVVIIYW